MSRLNDPENFRGRVNYAAKVIAYGLRATRAFDNCFENGDGEEVGIVILRRARNNRRLAANLPRYLDIVGIERAAERLADVPTRQLPDVAREARARCKAEFDAMEERRRQENPPAVANPSGTLNAGHYIAIPALHASHRILFTLEPENEHQIATLISGSPTEIQRFDVDCDKIVRGLAMLDTNAELLAALEALLSLPANESWSSAEVEARDLARAVIAKVQARAFT